MPSILQEADEIAGESRSRDYGHPLQNHQRIADVWNMQLGSKLNKPITAREVALMMVGLKLAREANTSKRDNLVDAAGYIKCVDMIDEALHEQDLIKDARKSISEYSPIKKSVAINPDMDKHAASQGLFHWKCISVDSFNLWCRSDGKEYECFTVNPKGDYADELRKFDSMFPLKKESAQ